MTTELATRADYDFDEAQGLAQIWAEESDGDFTPEFPRLRAANGIFDFGEDLAPAREARGVVVAWHKSTRLYLSEKDGDENTRPDAWSNDGKVQVVPAETIQKIDGINVLRAQANHAPLPYPHPDLTQCPYNKFAGDFPGKVTPLGATSGKDNNEYREIFIVLHGAESVVPYQISIPATSLKAWDGRGGYATGLITKGIRLAAVETVISATVEKGSGNEWTTYSFSRSRKLDDDTKNKALGYSHGVKEFVKQDKFAAARTTEATLAVGTVAQLAAPVAVAQAVAAAAAPVAAAQPAPVAIAQPQSVAPAPIATPVPVAPVPVVEAPAPVAVPVAPAAVAAPVPVAEAPAPVAPVAVAEPAVAPAPVAAAAEVAPAPAAVAAAAPVAVAAGAADGIDF